MTTSRGDDNSSGSENSRSRYEELLRPCRDLAANWNVDIVSKLSEYLVELEVDVDSLSSEEFANAQVNFQQAALVLEGGTCVYSRKVDYLYGLVFAAADMLYEARGKELPSRKARNVPGEIDSLETPTSDEVAFLLLDDELEASQPSREGITLPLRDFTDNCALLRARDANRLVSVPLHLLPPGPKNQRRTSSANQNTTGLRMADAAINVSTGALILDGIGIGDDEGHLPPQADLRVESGDMNASPEACSDIDGDCGGVYCSDDERTPTDESFSGQDQIEKPSETENQKLVDPVERNTGKSVFGTTRPQHSATEAPLDPFQPLDPHDPGCLPSRPVRRGRTWRRPRNEGRAMRVVAEAGNVTSSSLLESILGPSCSEWGRKSNRFVSFPAVGDQFKRNMRTISSAKRRRGLSDVYDASRIDDGILAADNVHEDVISFDVPTDTAFDEHVHPVTGLANDESDGDGVDDEHGVAESFPDFDDLSNANVDSRPYSHTSVEAMSERQIEEIAASYEEACRKYLLESSLLWQAHAADTQLEQRVSDWRSRIEPLLFLEEERAEFDIALYGDVILHRFCAQSHKTSSRETDMRSLFSASESFEVCRNFLAALQLVNNYKLGIAVSSNVNDLNPTVSLLETSRNDSVECTNSDMGLARDVNTLTPSKHHHATPQRRMRLPLNDISENGTITPRRLQQGGKRNRQAGSTPSSSRRATARSRRTVTPVK